MELDSSVRAERALRDPSFYPHRPAEVGHVQTHISHVFLAGPYVYKLKKPVRFPFLDFSTPALRRHFCEEEVRLNRRLAPDVYLGVVPIAVGAGGRLVLGGSGEPIEHVVWMRRLPAEGMLVERLARGAVTPAMIDEIAVRLAAFHAAAPSDPEVAAFAAPEDLRRRLEDTLSTLAPFAGPLLPAEDHALLTDFAGAFVVRHETLLRMRQYGLRIREGHGDLHAEHVCFVDHPIPCPDHAPLAPGLYVFDCIEFSRAFRSIDVAAEIGFLSMDLDCLGHPALARRLVRTYAAAADDPELEALVPFYGCDRAAVRGKVEALASEDPALEPGARAAAAERARRHLRVAVRYAWAAGGPAVIACAGLSGTGKSTLARVLADMTGFLLRSSDEIRGGTAGGPRAYGTGRYTPAARAANYVALVAAIEAALADGYGVVADATFIRRADRHRLLEAARRERRPAVFIECRADEDVVRRRLASREEAPSISEARWETYVGQRKECEPFTEDEPRIVVDTSGDRAATGAAAVRALWRWRQGRPA